MPSANGRKTAAKAKAFLTKLLAEHKHLDLRYLLTENTSKVQTCGGFGDIRQSTLARKATPGYGEDKVVVAIKIIRVPFDSDPSFAKAFVREIYVWSKLSHKNIMKLEGYTDFGECPSLVSRWAPNGTLVDYSKRNPKTDLVNLVSGVADGLAYLHNRDIVHSDLKGENILVSNEGGPMITDFGLSRMAQYSQSILQSSTSKSPRGSIRWVAYELLDEKVPLQDSPDAEDEQGYEYAHDEDGEMKVPDETSIHPDGPQPTLDEMAEQLGVELEAENVKFPKLKHTKETDMWAFGMVVYELLSGDKPYYNLASDVQVLMAIHNKRLPSSFPRIDKARERLWSICNSCWKFESENRLTIQKAVENLASITTKTYPVRPRRNFK